MVGVFDSGLGGLHILKALIQKFPQKDFLYLADTKNLPYGEKSYEELQRIALENILYLQEQDCSVIITACNTLSSLLSSLPHTFDVPVIGVIQPTINYLIHKYNNIQNIGIIATTFTINNDSYRALLKQANPTFSVKQIATPQLVPFIETQNHYELESYLGDMLEYFTPAPDVLILGCTHYGIVKNIIQSFLPETIIMDSSEAMTEELLRFDDQYMIQDLARDYRGTQKFITTKYASQWGDISESILGHSIIWQEVLI